MRMDNQPNSNSVFLKGHFEWALSKDGGEQTCCSLTHQHLHVVWNRLGDSHSPWNLDPKWRDSPEMRYGELKQGTSRTALLNTALPVSPWHNGGGGRGNILEIKTQAQKQKSQATQGGPLKTIEELLVQRNTQNFKKTLI